MTSMVIDEKDRLLINHPTTQILDAYRVIRTNLLAKLKEIEGKTVLVTSANKNEKKSNVSINLATTIAALGHKVLLLDCDMRTPQISKLLMPESKLGLSDHLEHDATLAEITQTTAIPNLSVIYSGEPLANSNELLNDGKMAKLLDTLKLIYDYIVLDAAPTQEVPDALVLTDKCDGAVIVARRFITKHARLMALVKQFAELRSNIVGFIMTE